MVKMLDPPLERIQLTRRLKKYLPVIAIHPGVAISARIKALELCLRQRKLLSVSMFFNLYEEFFDRESVMRYLKERYPEGTAFGAFQKDQLLTAEPAEKLQKFLFVERGIGLGDLYQETKFRPHSRLALEVLSLQLEDPPREWLEHFTEKDIDVLFELHTNMRTRFRYLQLWLEKLCGKLPATRAQILNSPPAGRLIEASTHPLKLGNPFEASTRWTQASEDLKLTAELYLVEQALDEFFSADGDHVRFDFWRQYADRCEGLKKFKKEGAFAMKLGDLWYVEFVPTGACYIYASAEFNSILSEGRLDLKWKNLCVDKSIDVVNSSGNRVTIKPPFSHIHRGAGSSYTWQRQFSEFIKRYS